MSDERWRPLYVRTAGTEAGYDGPFDGVPAWLVQPLIDWLGRNYLLDDPTRGAAPRRDKLHRVEVVLRVGLDWRFGDVGAYHFLLSVLKQDAQRFLSLVDLALKDLEDDAAVSNAIDHLDGVLRDGASAWMVAPDRRGLVKRVESEVAEAARVVIQSWPRAGHHLGEAWRKIFGREPDPSGGYHEAVKAVEVAVCPVIIPKHPKPTLGIAIAALRDAPPGTFATVFADLAPGLKPLDAVRELMSLVWTNQLDRHGSPDEKVPLQVSPEQAEAALFAAVTLVQWFHRGFVRAARA